MSSRTSGVAVAARGGQQAAPGRPGKQRVQRAGGNAATIELVYLVFHQGYERRHDQCRTRQDEGGELVSEGLAGPGRHHREHIASADDGSDDLFLARPEGAVPEAFAECRQQVEGRVAR